MIGPCSLGNRHLGSLGFNSPNIAQRHALHVERTAEKAFMLSGRVKLSSAEARVEEIEGGSVGVGDFCSQTLFCRSFRVLWGTESLMTQQVICPLALLFVGE